MKREHEGGHGAVSCVARAKSLFGGTVSHTINTHPADDDKRAARARRPRLDRKTPVRKAHATLFVGR
jgi:hypothetical protein